MNTPTYLLTARKHRTAAWQEHARLSELLEAEHNITGEAREQLYAQIAEALDNCNFWGAMVEHANAEAYGSRAQAFEYSVQIHNHILID